MESVVKAFVHVFNGVDSALQWKRVVSGLSQMDNFSIAQTWIAIAATIPKTENDKETFSRLLSYKLIFKQALKEVQLLQGLESNQGLVDINNVNRYLKQSIKLCSEYQTSLEKLEEAVGGTRARLQENMGLKLPVSESESSSANPTPQSGPIGHAPATIAPPSAELLQRVSELEKQAKAPSAQEAVLQAKFEELKSEAVKESTKQVLGKLEARLKQHKKDQEAKYEEQKQEQVESYTRLTDQLSGFGRKLDEAKLDIVNDTLIDLRRKADTAINARTEADTKVTALGTRLQALEDAGKSPAAAAGVDETKLENKITENVRIGLIADAKAKLDTLQKENTATLTAAIDAMKQETTVAVETVKKENTTAVSEMKEDWKKEVEELNTWLAEENERVKQGEDAMRQMVDEVHDMTEKAAFSNEVYHLAREKAGFGVSGMHIKAAIDQIGNGHPSSVDEVRKLINDKWAEPRHKDTAKSPYTAPAYVLPEQSTPAATRRQSLTGHKPATGPLPGAKRPASHNTGAGTRSMFSSIFGESPYVFADD